MTTEEMLLQLIEGQKQMSADITDMKKDITGMKKDITQLKTDVADIKEDISEMKEEIEMLTSNSNHNGEVLEQMVKDLAPLNMLNVKY